MSSIQEPRDVMLYDVVIVGAGPAGLSAAIRLKQLGGETVSVCVLEKGSEVGAHILSGAVFDPKALNELFPDWKTRNAPLDTSVTEDLFSLLTTPKKSFSLPSFLRPKLLNNHGNYVISLSDLCRWLAREAEALGVEIYPGFSCSEVLYGEKGEVQGVVAGVFGRDRHGTPKPSYQAGVEVLGKYTFFAEGARGSLTQEILKRFHLDIACSPQKFGLGIKELWEVDPQNHHPGRILHTLGWPLDLQTGGGGFAYHWGKNLVSVGFVVHLDYQNPYLSPYSLSQAFKHHPVLAQTLTGGRRISYGARVITEGGYQSIPKLAFPGGVLVGCAAGFVNVPKIKGSHNAMKTGMLAAESAYEALQAGEKGSVLSTYEAAVETSWVADELKIACNVKPLWSRFGLFGGIVLGGIDLWMRSLFGWSFFKVLRHTKPDHATLKPADESPVLSYPPFDGILSFDRTTNVAFSGTFHDDDQPVHLHLKDSSLPISQTLPRYAEPAQRYCPAQVYEVIEDSSGAPHLRINAQNCLHCKTCDIKDPFQNIIWRTPEGGGGPKYSQM